MMRSHQGAFELTGNQSWTWQQLSLLSAAILLPAALGVLARTDVTRRMLSAREVAVTRAGAVQSERARLAADLHDVVAHNVSLIAVRAEIAPYTSPGLGPGARQVLGEIADDARRALDELRGVLGVLHRAEESPELAPQPGMGDLPELVLRSTRAGDRIIAEGVDSRWIVPETVGYVVYRVVQEALTNARRHARGAPVELRLDREGDELVVVVANEAGQPNAAADDDGGAGLLGMAERVEALGGVVVAGPIAGGGFHVTARLPLTAHGCDDPGGGGRRPAGRPRRFRALLSAQADLEVVGQAADGAALVDLVLEHRPEVAVVDVRMPMVDGIEACRRIAAAGVGTRLLVVTTFDLDAYVYDALRAGASGFVLKDVPAARLVEAVRLVADGSMLLGPSVTRRLVEDVAARRPTVQVDGIADLTAREREVAVLVARGLSNAEIADVLVVGEQTVKSHVSEVLRKLGVRDRVQVVVLAYESRLVTPRGSDALDATEER